MPAPHTLRRAIGRVSSLVVAIVAMAGGQSPSATPPAAPATVPPAAPATAPATVPATVPRDLPIIAGPAVLHIGDTVTVAGRAMVGSGVLLQSRDVYVAVQGKGGSVWVFRRNSFVPVREGDSVQARGVLLRYRGSLEIVATSLTVVPTPKLVTPAADTEWPRGELPEGRLLRVQGIVGARGESEGGRWLRLHHPDHPDSLTIWIPWTHRDPPGLADVRTEDRLDVTGVTTIYRDNPGDPPVWQILPRRASDVQTIGIPRHVYRRMVQGAIAVAVVLVLVFIATRVLTRRQSRALRETEARYRQLLALSPDAVLVHDGDRVLFANAAAARLLGVGDEQALAGRTVDSFAGAEERAALDAAAGRRNSAGTSLGRRIRTSFHTADGTHVDVEVATSACRYHDRDAAVIVARDIGPQLRYERELRELALLDELTGLHNRRGFFMFAEAELRRLRERGSHAVLVFADLDGLKQINDRHGHAAGDQALRAVARALRDVVGEQGLAARWSGDEFVALVSDATIAAAAAAAAAAPNAPPPNGTDAGPDAAAADAFDGRLRAALPRHMPSTAQFSVSASVGARRLGPDAGETLATALAAADAGLYRRRGENRAPSAS